MLTEALFFFSCFFTQVEYVKERKFASQKIVSSGMTNCIKL